VYDWRKEAWARPKDLDGQYPLQVLDNGQEVWIVDPNKQLFGVVGFNKQTGQPITDGQSVGPDRQLAYARDVQKTRTASAITAGNGFRYAATGKYLAGSYDRSELPVPPWIKSPQHPQLDPRAESRDGRGIQSEPP
jgi:outer membrane lipoprotein-sorting protein